MILQINVCFQLEVHLELKLQMLSSLLQADSFTAFHIPVWAILSTYFGTAGFDNIFVDRDLTYLVLSIIIFTLFYVVVSVLFTNMLVCCCLYITIVISQHGCMLHVDWFSNWRC